MLSKKNMHWSSITFWPPFCCQTHRGMDSMRALKVCCGVRSSDVSSRSFKSFTLQGGASMDQTCFSSKSHRFSSDIWGILRPLQLLKLVILPLKPSLNHFCFVTLWIILPNVHTPAHPCDVKEMQFIRPGHLLQSLHCPVLMLTLPLLAFSLW